MPLRSKPGSGMPGESHGPSTSTSNPAPRPRAAPPGARRSAPGRPSCRTPSRSRAQAQRPATPHYGNVYIDHDRRLDLVEATALKTGLRHVGGEPRALHLYVEPGAEAEVDSAWRQRLGDRGLILPQSEAIGRGYFGPVAPHVHSRIGDFLVICADGFAVVDSEVESASALALIGHHGSTTDRELEIPLLVV